LERATYLDASAIVKLAMIEPESAALRRYLRRRRPLVSSAIARTEVTRALLMYGPQAAGHALDTLRDLDLIRVGDRILATAGQLLPQELRTLDAIHVATALSLGNGLARFCTYDRRMEAAAKSAGLVVVAPA
jgi:predicted nucleic acid-binding protein